MTYKILALDGGGIRGLYTARILCLLEEHCPGFLDDVDLIAGASTGGIIAILLGTGASCDDVINFYKKNLSKIFEDSFWDNIKDLGKLVGADYDYTNLRTIIRNKYKGVKLGDLKYKVVVPSFDLDNEADVNRSWKPKIWNNFQDGDELVVDIIPRIAAAPTYFPVFQGYVDGGTFSNNPSMLGLGQALDEKTGSQKLEDVQLLSIGTGTPPIYISGKRLDWGISQWASHLVDMLIDAQMKTADYQCKRLLKDRYHRINVFLDENIKLDDLDSMDKMIEYAEKMDMSETLTWMNKFWKSQS